MSDFSKSFLTEDRWNKADAPQVFVAAFGKHPGWDDHIEDLGLETPSLVLAKNLLYTQGIGGQIDSGAWEKLEAGQRIASFDHLLLWQRGDQFLLGNLWSSTDGKGRGRYPMVLCAHCIAAPLSWAIQTVLPALERMRQECQAARTANEVKAILSRGTAELRKAFATGAPSDIPLTPAERKTFLDCDAFGPQGEGWRRILHQITSQMSGYVSAQGSRGAELLPQQIRLPQCAPAGRSLALWREFFDLVVNRAAPLLLIAATGQKWIDATVGEPGTHEFFSLLADESKLPLASAIPYNMDEGVKRRADELANLFLTGAKTSGMASAQTTPKAAPLPTPKKSRRNVFLLGGVALVAVAVLAIVLRVLQSTPPSTLTATTQTPAVTNTAAVAAEQEKIRAQAQAEAEARVTAEAQALAKAQADAAAKAREEAAAAAEARKKAEQIADENRRAEAQARVEAQAKAEAELARKQAAEAAQREQERQAAEAKAREVAEQQRQHQLAQEVAFQASREEEQKRAAAAAAAVAPPPIVSQNSNSNLSVASVVEPPAKSDTPMTADRPGFDNTIGIAFVWVPDFPGTAHGAGVGKFEITQREYEQVMHANPSTAPGPDLPVQNVTGYDATNFCATLTDLEYSAGKLPKDWKYTLPSEAQFAYLSKDTRLEDSVTSHNLPKKRTAPQPVGSSGKTNNFGIYDVRGNVWEWCLAQDVGLVPLGGAFDGITETGAWATLGQGARENNLKPQMADNNTGFRVIVVPTAPVTPMHPPQSPK